MKSFTDIIVELGGATEAARRLGTSQQNAHYMMARNSIPAKYWPAVINHLPELSLADLAEMAVARTRGAA